MDALQLLEQKINQLIRAYASVQEENKKLQVEVAALRNEHQSLLRKNQTLEEAQATQLLGVNALSEAEKQNLRRYIDGVVDEIDKILTSLHE